MLEQATPTEGQGELTSLDGENIPAGSNDDVIYSNYLESFPLAHGKKMTTKKSFHRKVKNL